jgi:hypothetical protein
MLNCFKFGSPIELQAANASAHMQGAGAPRARRCGETLYERMAPMPVSLAFPARRRF